MVRRLVLEIMDFVLLWVINRFFIVVLSFFGLRLFVGVLIRLWVSVILFRMSDR